MDLRRADKMIILYDEDTFLCYGNDIVEKGGNNTFQSEGIRAAQERKCGSSNGRLDTLAGCDDVTPEPHRVIIAFVEREPGNCVRGRCAVF
jgi:hypothetical protein